MFKKLFMATKAQKVGEQKADFYRNLIRREAKIGGQLFGPIPKGGHREFFCLDEHTWVWHEEWIDVNNQHRTKTTRYDVRPNGILKAQDGQHYEYVSTAEAQHLIQAAEMYQQRVSTELYHLPA